MPRFVVNNVAQPNSGDHEVHEQGCKHWPSNYTELGDHQSCVTAVAAAKVIYRTADGCYWCSPACHKS